MHSKAVAEQTGVRNWIKSRDKLVRTSLKIQETAAFGSCSCGSHQLESLDESFLHSFYFLKPLN